jgi:hypothetical protein
VAIQEGFTMRQPILFTFLISLWLPLLAGPETTFTYQGQLHHNGVPFTGTPELNFRLFDSLTGANQIGETVAFSAIPVVDGLFQVELDFGTGVFNDGERWLEIEVAGAILDPRQKITGSPRALSVAAGAVGANQADSDQIQLRITGTCAPGTTLVGVNPDGSVACAALPIGLAYLADNDGSVGEYTSIAIRDNGIPIISYRDSTNNNLKAFDCANVACSSGTTRTLDNDVDVGGGVTSIAIRNDGHPIISYREGVNGQVRAYDCANAACSSGTVRILDVEGNVGAHTSIAIRNSGHPIISYFDQSNINLKAFDCHNAECSSGTARTLDSDGNVGFFTSIAIRDNGHPIISYFDSSNLNLKAFDCHNAECSSGTARTLDNVGHVGRWTSIAIGDDGHPIISYRDNTNSSLKAFHCANAECSSGIVRTLDNTGNVGESTTSITIRNDGRPIISYYDLDNGNLKVFDCGNAICSSGTARTLDSNSIVGLYSSIAIRIDGHPIISYFDQSNGNLKVFSCGDPNCAQ